MTIFARLKDDTPFNALFPDRLVPIIQVMPIRPNPTAPDLCYLVHDDKLSDEQLGGLARIMLSVTAEFKSIDEAIAYIHEGLPIKCSWFSGVTTSDPQAIAVFADAFSNEPEEDDDWIIDNCGLQADGTCLKVATEFCDWECPYTDQLGIAASASE